MGLAPSLVINLPGYPFENFPSIGSVAALRAVPSAGLSAGDNYVVDGGTAIGDGSGGVYVWSPSSSAVDDGLETIKPNDKSSGQAGRWIQAGGSVKTLRGDLANPANTLVQTRRASLLSAAEYRTLAAKSADTFDIRDVAGIDLTGNNDNAGEVQKALDDALSSGAVLHRPKGIIALDDTVYIDSGVIVSGEGCAPYDKSSIDGASRGAGSWFHITHSGQGFVGRSAGKFGSGAAIRGIGTYRTQPVPALGWTPNDHGFDFVCNQFDMLLEDVVLLNPTRGILTDVGNAGRLEMRRVRGQPFLVGLQCDSSFDGLIVDRYRWWPFWSNDLYTRAYTLANRKGMVLKHCDNPSFLGLFDIFSKYSVFFADSALPVSRAQFIAPEFDQIGQSGFYVEGGHDSASWQTIGGYCVGSNEVGTAYQSFVQVEGDGARIDFDGHRFTRSNDRMVTLSGMNNRFTVVGGRMEDWNVASHDVTAMASTGGSNAIFESGVDHSGGGGFGLVDDIGNISSDQWYGVFGLAVSSQLGALGAGATSSGRFQRKTKNVRGTLSITVPANGTASGDLRSTLPVPVQSAQNFYSTGRNIQTGQQLQAIANGNKVVITTTGNAYPIASGQTIEVTLDYECVDL